MKKQPAPELAIGVLNRRRFLQSSSALVGATALAGPLSFLHTKQLAAGVGVCGTRGPSPYGPLKPAKDEATGLDLIMLPNGFKYTTFSWKGDLMDDGNLVPFGHDGMAVVGAANPGGQPQGASQTYTLIRNHEVFYDGPTAHTPVAPDFNYDPAGGGGTSVVLFKKGKVVEQRISISGTIANCAGGRTPWNTWITCEEQIAGPDVPGDVAPEKHGYAFESTITRVTNPTPLTAMGRFAHEAVAFDPRTGIVYETEDNSASGTGDPNGRNRGQSGFYKFVPNNPLGGVGSLGSGGSLYMLKAVGAADLRNPSCFSTYDVEWVPVANPDSPPVGNASGPYAEGRSQGGTRFQRLEGCWWDPVGEVVVFVDTEAGPIGAEAGRTDRAEGAVWAYDPVAETLTALFVSQGALVPSAYGADNPDNCTVSPNGGILLCEDGGTNDGDGLSMLGLLPNGQSFEFARNIIDISSSDAAKLAAAGHDPAAIGTGNFSGQEWAGATFSPDGKTLFANIQTPGISFAITGPWGKGPF